MRRPRDRSRSAVPRSCGSPGSGDDLSPAWWPAWARREGSHGRQGTCPRCKGEAVTSPAIGASGADALPDYAPVPRSALGPALNDQGYHVGRVERNLYWVTDGTYQAASPTTTPSCSSTSSTPAGYPSTTSTSAKTCPATSRPRPPRCLTLGRTSSAATLAGSAPATTSACTSSTSPTSKPAPGRRSPPSTRPRTS